MSGRWFKARVPATIFAIATGLAPLSRAADSSIDDLRRQIAALQQRVDQLAAQRLPPEQVDATVRRVLDDADRRSRVLDSSQLQAGWDPTLGKFVIRSADGNISVSPFLVGQFRGVAAYRQGAADGSAGTESGLETRRTRIGLEGNLAARDLTYRILWETARELGGVSLLDAWARYKLTPDWSLRAGQMTDPWTQEWNIAPARQLTVERSAMNAMIGAALTDRVQGVGLSYDRAKPIRGQVLVHDGANSKNTAFTDGPTSALPALGGLEAFGVTGRVEYFAAGTPKQYEDYSAISNTQDLLVFGAGGDYTQGGDNDVLFHAADVQYERADGLGLFAEYMGQARSIGPGSTSAPAGRFYDYGFLAQGSYLLTPKWEVFTRYDWTHLDPAAFTASRAPHPDEVQEMTVGVNYYLHKHSAKITIDLNYLPDGSPNLPALGYLATSSDALVLRTQLQLAL